MRFSSVACLLATLVASVAAEAPMRSVLVTYPAGTPDSVVQKAKDEIVQSGGEITHEYNIIQGFAAIAPAKTLETVSIMDTEFQAIIEEDGIVSANGGGGFGI